MSLAKLRISDLFMLNLQYRVCNRQRPHDEPEGIGVVLCVLEPPVELNTLEETDIKSRRHQDRPNDRGPQASPPPFLIIVFHWELPSFPAPQPQAVWATAEWF